MAKRTTAPKKKKTVRVSRRLSGYGLMPTDNWHKAKHFVHHEIESKDWLMKVKEYIKKNCTKEQEAAINKLPDWKICSGSHWPTTVEMLTQNPEIVPEAYKTGIKKLIENLLEQASVLIETKAQEDGQSIAKNVHVPTIQERIFAQSQEACEAIEEWLEGFVTDRATFDPKGFDFKSHFAKHNVSQAHARKILSMYQGELEEAGLIIKLPTPGEIKKIKDEREADYALQLREGYGHIKKADAQRYLEALETLAGACNLVIDASKAARKPRLKKAPSKEKLVAGLKYKDTDEKYQLVSVNPLELLDSTEIWIFNSKTRKLGKYVAAEDARTMSIKGSTLIGFDDTKSVQKTLRKPEEVLKEFKKVGKVKLRTFMDTITTTETKLNGRLNSDTVILRVN